MQNRHRQSGFTPLELLIALSLLAIITALAVAAFDRIAAWIWRAVATQHRLTCGPRRATRPIAAGRKGFTILEFLIVLAVVSVLVTIAVPSFRAMVAHNRLASASNELLSSLYLLRSEAAKRNRIMKMCRRPSSGLPICDSRRGGAWDAGWLLWADDDNNSQVDPDEVIVSQHQGFRGAVRLTGNGSVVNRIAFQPIGSVSGVGNGTFTACVPGSTRVRQIIISKAGRIRTRTLQGDGSC